MSHFSHKNRFLDGFHTKRSLQWNLGMCPEGPCESAIPYSLEHVDMEGWLVGDQVGRIWQLEPGAEVFEEIIQFPCGVSEITAQARNCVLVGDMRGRVTRLDLSNFTDDTVQQLTAIDHLSPVKCIRFFSEHVIATASQDGSVKIVDLRTDELIACLAGIHAIDAHKNARATCTGLVLNPSRPHLFYTCGTPDPDVRTWDLRKLPNKRSLRPVEQFTPALQSKRHRSSVSLTIDSCGSRLFLSTTNNSIFEFLTLLPEHGPVAEYTTPGFTSCSFYSNLTIDPTDRYLVSGSADGNAYIWNTRGRECHQLPVAAQLEVSKCKWIGDGQQSKIACISDDMTFSIFDWGLDANDGKYSKLLDVDCRNLIDFETTQLQSSTLLSSHSLPGTPKKSAFSNSVQSSPFNNQNKSILDFFSRSPRPQ